MLAVRDDGKGNKTSHFLSVLQTAVELQKRKVIHGPNDLVGIMFFNTVRAYAFCRDYGSNITLARKVVWWLWRGSSQRPQLHLPTCGWYQCFEHPYLECIAGRPLLEPLPEHRAHS